MRNTDAFGLTRNFSLIKLFAQNIVGWAILLCIMFEIDGNSPFSFQMANMMCSASVSVSFYLFDSFWAKYLTCLQWALNSIAKVMISHMRNTSTYHFLCGKK